MALLAGLLLFGQVAAQPVAAAEPSAAGTHVLAQGEKAPNKPGGPGRPDDFTAGPMPDIKVELVSGWWVGDNRHSKFRILNDGNGTGAVVHVWYQSISQNVPEDETDNPSHKFDILNMAPGASQEFTVVCDPREEYVCDKNKMWAGAHGAELNDNNNRAEDDV